MECTLNSKHFRKKWVSKCFWSYWLWKTCLIKWMKGLVSENPSVVNVLSRFFVSLKSLNNYFFKGFAYKSFLNRFSVLINYIMWFSNHFSTSSCFLRFSGSRLFRVQVFLSPGFSRSMFFRVKVFQGPSVSGSGSRF